MAASSARVAPPKTSSASEAGRIRPSRSDRAHVGGARQQPIADGHVAAVKIIVIDAGGDAMAAE